jgi:hypothetical protein
MAVRHIVGRKIGDTAWIGRYVHWNGTPNKTIPVLVDLVLRHGLNKTVSTVVFNQEGWYALSTDLVPGYSEEEHIEGFGVPAKEKKKLVSWESDNEYDARFAYIFDNKTKSIEILSYYKDKWVPFDMVDYGPAIYRVENRISNIQEEVERKWREHLVQV